MTWVRYDDQAAIHRKVAALDDATYRLWREAIEWCSRNLTDGRIAADELAVVSVRANRARAAKLVERGLWHPADHLCGSEKCPPSGTDGWVIHDYWQYQFTREHVLAEKAAKAERQKRWLEGRKKDASRDASYGASLDGMGDGTRDAERDKGGPHNGRKPPLPKRDHRSWSGTTDDTSPVDNLPDQRNIPAKDASLDALETHAPSPSPPRREAGTWNVPEKRPAANHAYGAADRSKIRCPTCGNTLESAYHRNTCQATLSA